jgi:hypothetical protein
VKEQRETRVRTSPGKIPISITTPFGFLGYPIFQCRIKGKTPAAIAPRAGDRQLFLRAEESIPAYEEHKDFIIIAHKS